MSDAVAPVGETFTATFRRVLDDLDRLRPQIDAALEYTQGTHTFDDVCAMVLQGRVRFWPLSQSFMITEVLDFPRQRHYHMWLGGGDLQEILDMHETILSAARDANCQKLTVNGRAGWMVPLKKHGWEFSYSALSRDV